MSKKPQKPHDLLSKEEWMQLDRKAQIADLKRLFSELDKKSQREVIAIMRKMLGGSKPKPK